MSVPISVPIGLVADIGGTNVRFALCRPGDQPYDECVLTCSRFSGPIEAAKTYLATVQPTIRPTVGAFAVASPVTGDSVIMTNHNWQFSIEDIRQALDLGDLHVINDFAAVALCVPCLTPNQYFQVGSGLPVADAPIGVLGAGTGLGVAFLIPDDSRWHAVSTEGGHVTMPAVDDHESTVLAVLRRRFGHVSAERILSGPGLVNLYSALAEMAGRTVSMLTPAAVTERGMGGIDSLCVEAVQMFLGMLGTVAGNLALTIGARGGIYIAGGIVPHLAASLQMSSFRARFEGKGRFHSYVEQVPTYIITHPYPGLLGLSKLLG